MDGDVLRGAADLRWVHALRKRVYAAGFTEQGLCHHIARRRGPTELPPRDFNDLTRAELDGLLAELDVMEVDTRDDG